LGDRGAERRGRGHGRTRVDQISEAGCLIESGDSERGQPEQVQHGLSDADVGAPPTVDADLDPAAEHQQRDPGAVGQLDPVGGVFDVRGCHVVIEPAPVVPGQQEHGVVPQPGGHDRVDGLPDLVLALAHIGYRVLVIRAVVPDHAQPGQVRCVGDDLVAAYHVG
jgi:hypothetical protein